MSDTIAFDRQLGDVVWLISQALRAGYSVRQCIEHLSIVNVEPTASAFKALVEDLQAGRTIDEAFVNLLETWPSPHLKRIIDVILEQRKTGGTLAERIGAMLPERVNAG